MLNCVTVSASAPYGVSVGAGLLPTAGAWLRGLFPAAQRVLLVTDDNVVSRYGTVCNDSLRAAGFGVETCVLPHGEQYKTLDTVGVILSQAAAADLTGGDVFLALGGGVVIDLCGLCASLYRRGTPWAVLPTTVVGGVDAAIGGKTACNLPEGKNLAGAFWQPQGVLCDTETWSTLPPREYTVGCAEIAKYALLAGEPLFSSLKASGKAFDRVDVCTACVRQKAGIVSHDERDAGERRFLNFGHTVGHALESATAYSLSHGEAVAVGMAWVTRAAEARGLCRRGTAEAAEALLDRLGLPTCAEVAPETVAEYIRRDKKRTGDTVNLVLVRDVGDPYVYPITLSDLTAFLADGRKGCNTTCNTI